MIFIGDIHGLFRSYRKLCRHLGGETFQVGDLGVGFPGRNSDERYTFRHLDGNKHKFIRGNHDNPAKIRGLKGYLGDYGYLDKNRLFYLGGGLSIDKRSRTDPRNIAHYGITWWEDEELSHAEFVDAIALYERVKPEVVVTHECPYRYISQVGDPDMATMAKLAGRSRTSMALDLMLDAHRPKVWIFGHFHIRKTFEDKDTRFEALDMYRSRIDYREQIDKVTVELKEVSW